MAGRMSSEFERLVRERKLSRARTTRRMVFKEIDAAGRDLEDSRDSLGQGKFKWATIQGYYSMFHAARALLYNRGFRERSHYALLVAIKDMFRNSLSEELINSFEEGMELRQEADYGLVFSEEGASETIEGAERFLMRAKEILKTSRSMVGSNRKLRPFHSRKVAESHRL